MEFIKTSLEDLIIIKPEIKQDDRGYFLESFIDKEFSHNVLKTKFVQENESRSKINVLRGLHFQKKPFAQAKLIKCTKGEILDVAVDIRKNSKTFGMHNKTILSSKNKYQLFIPEGFAHGFLVISKYAIVTYKVNNYYNPDAEAGIKWNDPDLCINWGVDEKKILISKKDNSLPYLKKIKNNL